MQAARHRRQQDCGPLCRRGAKCYLCERRFQRFAPNIKHEALLANVFKPGANCAAKAVRDALALHEFVARNALALGAFAVALWGVFAFFVAAIAERFHAVRIAFGDTPFDAISRNQVEHLW